jgi:membrane protease YdiL (CAAX protease family)
MDQDRPRQGGVSEAGRESLPGLRPAAILPGLLLVLLVDLLSVCGWVGSAPIWGALPLVMAVLPWATLVALRLPASALGYTRRRAVARYGWGILAGAIWRGASMLFNIHWAAGWLAAAPIGQLLQGLVIVPLVEETFFRGYLEMGLRPRLGWAGAILAQAVLFTLLPVHWGQGLPAVFSVFGFGVLSGFLVARTGTIWASGGAHGFANILPGLLSALVTR